MLHIIMRWFKTYIRDLRVWVSTRCVGTNPPQTREKPTLTCTFPTSITFPMKWVKNCIFFITSFKASPLLSIQSARLWLNRFLYRCWHCHSLIILTCFLIMLLPILLTLWSVIICGWCHEHPWELFSPSPWASLRLSKQALLLHVVAIQCCSHCS